MFESRLPVAVAVAVAGEPAEALVHRVWQAQHGFAKCCTLEKSDEWP